MFLVTCTGKAISKQQSFSASSNNISEFSQLLFFWCNRRFRGLSDNMVPIPPTYIVCHQFSHWDVFLFRWILHHPTICLDKPPICMPICIFRISRVHLLVPKRSGGSVLTEDDIWFVFAWARSTPLRYRAPFLTRPSQNVGSLQNQSKTKNGCIYDIICKYVYIYMYICCICIYPPPKKTCNLPLFQWNFTYSIFLGLLHWCIDTILRMDHTSCYGLKWQQTSGLTSNIVISTHPKYGWKIIFSKHQPWSAMYIWYHLYLKDQSVIHPGTQICCFSKLAHRHVVLQSYRIQSSFSGLLATLQIHPDSLDTSVFFKLIIYRIMHGTYINVSGFS